MSNYVLPKVDAVQLDNINYIYINNFVISLGCLGRRMFETNYQGLDLISGFCDSSQTISKCHFSFQLGWIRCCCMWGLTWSYTWVVDTMWDGWRMEQSLWADVAESEDATWRALKSEVSTCGSLQLWPKLTWNEFGFFFYA